MNSKVLATFLLLALGKGVAAKGLELQREYENGEKEETQIEQLREQMQLLIDFNVINIQGQDIEISDDADILLEELNERNLLKTPYIEKGTMCY